MSRNIVVVRTAPRKKTVRNIFWKLFKLSKQRKSRRRNLNA